VRASTAAITVSPKLCSRKSSRVCIGSPRPYPAGRLKKPLVESKKLGRLSRLWPGSTVLPGILQSKCPLANYSGFILMCASRETLNASVTLFAAFLCRAVKFPEVSLTLICWAKCIAFLCSRNLSSLVASLS
jgi:hypothetical protein